MNEQSRTSPQPEPKSAERPKYAPQAQGAARMFGPRPVEKSINFGPSLRRLLGYMRPERTVIVFVILLAVVVALVVGWPLLISLFSTPKYEAEADALDAVLRRTVDRANGGQAVA